VANGFGSGKKNFLYLNNGDGTFTKITNSPVTSVSGFFTGCSWADYDRDGFLDLFVANDPIDNSPSLLFHNNGDGTFTKTTSVVSIHSHAISGAWADYNNDGWPDLLVANGFDSAPTASFLYQNLGAGNFQLLTGANYISVDGSSVGVAWGDYDNDGLPDVFITNNGQPNELYHNNGNGTFTRVTAGDMLVDMALSVAASWGDYDNDDWLDLFVGNRDPNTGAPAQPFLYHNNGDGTFAKVTAGPIAEALSSCGGCAWGDYDNDGFLDLFVSSLSTIYSSSGTIPGGQNALFHNTGNANHWLKVKCIGSASNRSAIGAKVRVKAVINGKSFWQLREITSGDGFGSAALTAHFGLGNATNVDTLRIEWPSGTVQEFHDVASKQLWTVTEPPRLSATLRNSAPQFTIKGGGGFRYDLQVSTDLAAWSPLGTLTITNVAGTADIVDPNSPGSSRRFYRALQHP
jgi:hypothetical protein